MPETGALYPRPSELLRVEADAGAARDPATLAWHDFRAWRPGGGRNRRHATGCEAPCTIGSLGNAQHEQDAATRATSASGSRANGLWFTVAPASITWRFTMRTARLPSIFAVPVVAACLFGGIAQGCAGVKAVPSEELLSEAVASLSVEDRLNISEAVWRHQMNSIEPVRWSGWFLWLESNDPPAELLERFAGIKTSPGSQYVPGKGVRLHIQSIEATSDGALVRASLTLPHSGSAEYDYTLRHEGGAWRVIKEQLRGMS
jgi:hypothetical protein